MSDSTPLSPDPYAQIWADDLFSRRNDATMLAAYIESVVGRPSLREDHKGFTISVDAEYGTGKSFFLKRLARHLSITYPVAFVDAWADDLADDPLTAIAATLKKALDPLAKKDKYVAASMGVVTGKVGTIAKLVSKGIAKKAIALALTESVSDELFDAINNGVEETEEVIKDAASIVSDGVVDGLGQKSPNKLMADRISNFEVGQAAVLDLKKSLSSLVESLKHTDFNAPIVVIIDELDRCRPPYAIKLLEELKHLFDVSGIVFILGLNSQQLSKSIKAAYGPEFDGVSYLRRFIDRQYTLSVPDLHPLLIHIVRALSLDVSRLQTLQTRSGNKIDSHEDPTRLIALYMEMYGLNARSAFAVGDVLQTCLAITSPNPLFMPLLMPYVIAKVLHVPASTLTVKMPPRWAFILYSGNFDNKTQMMLPDRYFNEARDVAEKDQNDLMVSVNNGNNVAVSISSYLFNKSQTDFSSPANYARLMEAVSRFS